MLTIASRYAGHLLIFAGLAILTLLIRSAAGPIDGLGGARLQPPPEDIATTGQLVPGTLLIARPQPAAVSSATVAPTAEPTATAEPAPAPVVESQPPAAEAPSLPPTDRIVIPRIRLDTKIVDVGVLPSGEMATAAFAAGRLTFSAQAGESGNLVVAGHDDIQGEVFRRLPEVQVGDAFTVFRGDQAFSYRVEVRTIVREDGATEAQRLDNAKWIEPTEDPVATLISCYPYRVDTHRIIVRARLVA